MADRFEIARSECRIKHGVHGQIYNKAIPYPVHFDIENCEPCSFFWMCQMINRSLKGD